jgi:4-hydroxyphenylpyruvate dioxygenase
MGTDGFEFVEYTAPDIELLRDLFSKMGFPRSPATRARTSRSQAGRLQFRDQRGARQLCRGLCQRPRPERLRDGVPGHRRQGRARPGARARRNQRRGKRGDGELDIPAIEGIGGSRLFFVDRYADKGSIYEVDFDFHPDWRERMAQADSKLTYVDHLTHNVNRGNMATWADFYERLFNFREIRYFDIEGRSPACSPRR